MSFYVRDIFIRSKGYSVKLHVMYCLIMSSIIAVSSAANENVVHAEECSSTDQVAVEMEMDIGEKVVFDEEMVKKIEAIVQQTMDKDTDYVRKSSIVKVAALIYFLSVIKFIYTSCRHPENFLVDDIGFSLKDMWARFKMSLQDEDDLNFFDKMENFIANSKNQMRGLKVLTAHKINNIYNSLTK